MCQRNLMLPVPLLAAVALLGVFAVIFGFVYVSARVKNRVDRRQASPQEVLAATEALVGKNPSVHNAISFSSIDQTTVEHWDGRRWRVSGYVDTRPQAGVKVRTLYFAVVQQDGKDWNLEDLQLQSMEFSKK
jgi:membrane protein implicated in regulation of membrane protease activity